MRRVHENEQIRQLVDRARETVVNDRGDRLGDLLDNDLRHRLPNHPELARIIEGNGPPPLSPVEGALRDSLMARPRTLHSLLSQPEAVHILEDSVREVNERGADAILGEGRQRPLPTPFEGRQLEISNRVADEVGGSKSPDQPGFDEKALEEQKRRLQEGEQLSRDNPLINDYLDDLYNAADAHKDTLNNVLKDLANDPDDAKMRPGRKDRVRALDKIIIESGGNPSKLNDLLGGKVQFDSVADLYQALDRVQEVVARHGVEIVSIKDRLQNPQPSGYRDIRMTVRMPNGHIGELRLHLRSVDEVAAYEHSLYEVSRDLPNVAAEAAQRGERSADLSPEERALREAVNRRLITRFQAALDDALPPHLRSTHGEGGDAPEPHRRTAEPARAEQPQPARPEGAGRDEADPTRTTGHDPAKGEHEQPPA
ncbi:hypothetical protein, partial [Actinomadura rubrisoli]